ncbi:MAG: hypothetical protein IJ806_11810 [Ruminococcus sp.]|nr:hypothetical protein [Ruminococcus sp.]
MSILGKSVVFIGGMLFSTAGVKILSSKTAKKVYAHTTAAAIRCKDAVMEGVTAVREGCGDILSDAKDINEKMQKEKCCCEKEDIIEDESEDKDETEK